MAMLRVAANFCSEFIRYCRMGNLRDEGLGADFLSVGFAKRDCGVDRIKSMDPGICNENKKSTYRLVSVAWLENLRSLEMHC